MVCRRICATPTLVPSVSPPARRGSPINAPDVAKRRDFTESGVCRILIVAAVMAATLMQTLDSTITNVTLPKSGRRSCDHGYRSQAAMRRAPPRRRPTSLHWRRRLLERVTRARVPKGVRRRQRGIVKSTEPGSAFRATSSSLTPGRGLTAVESISTRSHAAEPWRTVERPGDERKEPAMKSSGGETTAS
jgi:hypothetical protein